MQHIHQTLAAAFFAGSLCAAPVALEKGATVHAPGKQGVALAAQDGVLPLQWDPADAHIAINLKQPMSLKSPNATVTVNINAPADCSATGLGLRVVDAKGETFQFGKSVNFAKGGDFTVEYTIALDQPFSTWGGNNDKILDYPIKLYGFGIDYNRKKPASGFKLTKINVETDNTGVTVAKADLTPGVTIYVPGGKPYKQTNFTSVPGSTTQALKVQFNPKGSNYVELGLNRFLKVGKFQELTVVAQIHAPVGSPIRSLGLRLRDAKDETFQFSKPVDFSKGGIFDVEWEITPALIKESWGGNNDKKFDWPVSVAGFGIDYRRDSDSAEFQLLSLRAERSADPNAPRFQPISGATIYGPGLKPVQMAPRAEIPGEKEKAVLLTWTPAASKYVEVVMSKQYPIGDFRNASITLKFYTPEANQIRNIGLRLIDAKGEVFQYSKSVSFAQPGFQEITWDVTPTGHNGCWGGNNDKKFDMPGKVFAFGIDYPQTMSTPKLYLVSVKVETSGGGGDTATRTLYTFDENNRFAMHWNNAKLNQKKNELTLSFSNGNPIRLNERKDNLIRYNAPLHALVVESETIGDAPTIRWGFRDARNRLYQSEPTLLTQRSTRIPLQELLEDATLPIRIDYLELKGTAKSEVSLRSVALLQRQPLIEAVDPEILTGNALHILKADGADKLGFSFTNRSSQSGKFRFSLEIKSAVDHSTGNFTFDAELKPGETKFFKPAWKPEKLGHYDVAIRISEAGSPGKTFKINRSFAYLKPAGPTPGRAPGFLFSICSHIGRWAKADQDKEIEALSLCGAKVVRDSIEWGGMQPAPDRWNFAPMDYMVEELGKKNIELQALLAFTAKWAAPQEKQNSKNWLDWSRCFPDQNAWRNYVRTMVERYKGKIRYWEVWNEPDLAGFNGMNQQQYAQLQKSSFEEIRKADPQAKVMTGGFATMTDHPGRKDKNFHRNHLVEAKGFFDVHAYHEHGSFINYASLVDNRFLPMRHETGTTVPWYANETAIHSMGGSERNQAVTLFKKLLFSWARGAIGYTWYDLRNDGFDSRDAEHHYGMITNDFYPKMVYSVFNMLAGEYRDARYVRQLDCGVGRWIFEFKRGNDILIPAWDESQFSSTLPIVVETDAKKANAVDLFGNRRTVALLNGKTLLEVNQTPYTLELVGASTGKLLKPLLTVNNSFVIVPGKPCQFAVELYNPLSKPAVFRLNLQNSITELHFKQLDQVLTVAPGTTARAQFEAQIAPSFKPEYGTTHTLKMQYALENTDWQGNILIPVNSALSIPAGNFDRKPDFILDRRDQTVSLAENDPAKRHRIWQDAKDLSARIHLGVIDGQFRLKAVVTDDRHCQPETGVAVWRGDNVQFAFQLPGQNGSWEIGLSRLDNGTNEVFVFLAPTGFDAAVVQKTAELHTSLKGDQCTYEFAIPLAALGLTRQTAEQGFKFNLLINDNDGEGRDGWIHIAPGIGENKNPDKFPVILFER